MLICANFLVTSKLKGMESNPRRKDEIAGISTNSIMFEVDNGKTIILRLFGQKKIVEIR